MKDIEPGHMPQTPGNPINVTSFNLKNASPKFGMKEGEGDLQKMYHNTAPPTIQGTHYQDVEGISNFADVGNKREGFANMKMSSFQNAMAATNQKKPEHSSFISMQMVKGDVNNKQTAMESRRCRALSNEYSHDFMAKMKKGGDQSPQPTQRLHEIMGNFLSIAEEDREHDAYD